jgi:hypothetical protein
MCASISWYLLSLQKNSTHPTAPNINTSPFISIPTYNRQESKVIVVSDIQEPNGDPAHINENLLDFVDLKILISK